MCTDPLDKGWQLHLLEDRSTHLTVQCIHLLRRERTDAEYVIEIGPHRYVFLCALCADALEDRIINDLIGRVKVQVTINVNRR